MHSGWDVLGVFLIPVAIVVWAGAIGAIRNKLRG